MGTIDNNGIYVYDEGDQIAPFHTLLNQGQAATSAAIGDIYSHALVMPVANTAERDAYEQQMRDAGRPPTAASPLYAETANNGVIHRNRGDGWRRLVDNRVQQTTLGGAHSAWQRNNTLVKKNGWVYFRLRQKRTGPFWSGTSVLTDSTGLIPAEYRPAADVWDDVHVYLRNDYHRTTSLAVSTGGVVTAYNLRIGTGNWLSGTYVWPTED